MSRISCLARLTALATLVCLCPAGEVPAQGIVPQAGSDLGSVEIVPAELSINNWHSLELRFTVGPEGLLAGGGLKIQFAKIFHARMQHGGPQSAFPGQDSYVSARCSVPGAGVSLAIQNQSLDGRLDTSDWTVTLLVLQQDLSCGDTITYVLGDTSGGGRGWITQERAGTYGVRVAVDNLGTGEFVEMESPAQVTLTPQMFSGGRVLAPSTVKAGEPFVLRVLALDLKLNPTGQFAHVVRFTSTDPGATLPRPYNFLPSDQGLKTFSVTLGSEGTHRIIVTDVQTGKELKSNPIQTHAAQPPYQILWGDIHSHSGVSFDAVGEPEQALLWARDTSGLDFYALTDHDRSLRPGASGMTPEEWEATRSLLGDYYQPGSFVTLRAFEWTCISPYGHRNVYYRDLDGPLLYVADHPTLESLWAALEGIEALTIPHHVALNFGVGNHHWVSWDYRNDRLQPATEVYSLHGQFEYYNPGDPLSPEIIYSGLGWTQAGPHTVRDGWMLGQTLGVVAGSDDHSSRPGMPHAGLTAVYAEDFTREAVYDAMKARRTYATTGKRLLVRFEADGHGMGEVYEAESGHQPLLSGRVVGESELEFVQLIKGSGPDFEVIWSAENPGADAVSFSIPDEAWAGRTLYYVRAKEVGSFQNRAVMAWSSPIWVLPAGAPSWGVPEASADSPGGPSPSSLPGRGALGFVLLSGTLALAGVLMIRRFRRSPEKIRVPGLLLLLAGVVVALPRASAGFEWEQVRVDFSDSVGQYSSLKCDPQGRPRISYLDSSHYNLKYASCEENCTASQNWVFLNIDYGGDSGGFTGGYSSLALDGDGRPRVSYVDWLAERIKYAFCDFQCDKFYAWKAVSLPQAGLGTSLALTPAGDPRIAYFNVSEKSLGLLLCDGNCRDAFAWQQVMVETEEDVGFSASLAAAGDSALRISYLDANQGTLKYASCESSCDQEDQWTRIVVDDGAPNSSQVGMYTSLALDAGGNPRIAYQDQGRGDLKYAFCDGDCRDPDSWTKLAVVTAGNAGLFNSLALDQGSSPRIAFYDASDYKLKLASCELNCQESAGWRVEVVDAEFGTMPSLALDPQGNPRISYFGGQYDYDLVYAAGAPFLPWEPSGAEADAAELAGATSSRTVSLPLSVGFSLLFLLILLWKGSIRGVTRGRVPSR